jgi:hypothetical protein
VGQTRAAQSKKERAPEGAHLGLDLFEFEVGQGFPLVAVIIEDILIFEPLQQFKLVGGEQEIKVFIILFIVDNNSLTALGLGGRLSVVSALGAGEDFFVVVSRMHFVFLYFFTVSLLYHTLLDLSRENIQKC